jgi:hypothetical protein
MKFKKRHLVAQLARVWGTLRVGAAQGPGLPASGPVPPSVGPASDAEMFDRFEGLGDGCEFAAVQQLAGIDRLGLFKWAGVDLPVLTALLDSDLDGVDDPAQIALRLEPRPSGHFEYMIDHHVMRCCMHAGASLSYLDSGTAKAREVRRIALMKRKFLEDVRAGRRIYLYASLKPRPIAEVEALFDALQRFGPNRLLFVREADAALAAGEVRLLRPGLAEAAIDALALYETGTTIRTALWPALVRTAHALLAPEEAGAC